MALSAGLIVAILVLVVLNIFAIVFGLGFIRANRQARQHGRRARSHSPASPSIASHGATSSASSLIVVAARVRRAVRWRDARLPVAQPQGWVRLGDRRRQHRRHQVRRSRTPARRSTTARAASIIVPYSGQARSDARLRATGATERGPHGAVPTLRPPGLPRPFCGSRKWFECPCHGSKYNEAGEYQLGPAPRGHGPLRVTVEGNGTVLRRHLRP